MWKDLTLEQKAEIMKMSVANGVTDINDIQQLYDGSVGHRFDDAGRIITLADLPREYVQRYGHINVVTPKGVRMPLSQAYRDYNQTPINVNDVPGLTDYLIKQDQPDISEQAHLDKVAADRFVHQLGEERDKALIGLTAAITGGGALASGLALAPVATISSTIGGIAGEKAFNAGYEELTGNNWGQDVERWTNGYIPAEYGEYLNPGALVGGVTAEPLRKFVGRNAYKGFLNLPQTKRAVEVAMRTTGFANPLEEMSAHVNYLRHAPEGRQQVKDILHYIATGKRQTDRPYRSLNSQGDVYTGLIGDYPEEFEYEPLIQIPEALSKDIGNDYIDAYLYGKQMSPKLFNYKGTSDKVDNAFKEYVNTVYPNKKVQVYEAPIPHNARVVNQNELTDIHNHGISKPMHTNDSRVVADTSGHLMYTANMNGANPEMKALKEADIWKFNPADYKERYKLDSTSEGSTTIKQKVKQKLIDTGLKIVDDIGNPVIIETPWYILKNGGHLFDKGGSKKDYIDPNVSIYTALKQAGIPFKTSNPSGYRGPGHYVGKAGPKSQHAQRRPDGTAWALDITGDFNEIRRKINASKPLQDYFRANGIIVSEELTKEALARTGGTGPHFHIGRSSGHNHQNNPTIAAFNRVYGNQNMTVPNIDYESIYEPAKIYGLDWSNRPQQEEQTIQRPTEPIMSVMEREEPQQEQTPVEQDNFVQLPSFRLASLQSQPIVAQQKHALVTPVMQVAAQEAPPEVQSILSSPYIIFGRDLG